LITKEGDGKEEGDIGKEKRGGVSEEGEQPGERGGEKGIGDNRGGSGGYE